MALFSELTTDILTESNGCPEMILERHIRNASIDFFTESELWQDQVIIPSQEGVGEYDIPRQFDIQVLKLIYCEVDGRVLIQTVPQRTFAPKGRPEHYFLRNSQLHLRPYDRVKGDIRLEVVYRPTRSSVEIPDEYADSWFETIQYGALARTLSMPGQPWYDPRRAAAYSEQYLNGLDEARREGTHQNHSRIKTTRFSW